MIMQVKAMRAIFGLPWWAAISSVLFFLLPLPASGLQVQQSTYDWDVAATNQITLPIHAGDDAVDAALYELVFLDSDGDTPTLRVLDQKLAEIFTVSLVEREGSLEAVVQGTDARLSVTDRVLALLFSTPSGEGVIGVQSGLAVPIFLRTSIDVTQITVQAVVGPRVVFRDFLWQLRIHNAASAPAVPNGAIRALSLFGYERAIVVNPGALRIPAGTSRDLFVPVSLPAGLWRLQIPVAEGVVDRWVLVLNPGIIVLLLTPLVILVTVTLRRHARHTL